MVPYTDATPRRLPEHPTNGMKQDKSTKGRPSPAKDAVVAQRRDCRTPVQYGVALAMTHPGACRSPGAKEAAKARQPHCSAV